MFSQRRKNRALTQKNINKYVLKKYFYYCKCFISPTPRIIKLFPYSITVKAFVLHQPKNGHKNLIINCCIFSACFIHIWQNEFNFKGSFWNYVLLKIYINGIYPERSRGQKFQPELPFNQLIVFHATVDLNQMIQMYFHIGFF